MEDYEIVISIIVMLVLGAFTIFCAVASIAGTVSMIGFMWGGIASMVFYIGVVLYNLYMSY